MWPFFAVFWLHAIQKPHYNTTKVTILLKSSIYRLHLIHLYTPPRQTGLGPKAWLVQGTKTENALKFAGPMYLFERTAIKRTLSTDLRIWALTRKEATRCWHWLLCLADKPLTTIRVR